MELSASSSLLWWQLMLLGIAARSWKRNSLTAGGSIAAWLLGTVTAWLSPPTLISFLVFFLAANFATKCGVAMKARKHRNEPWEVCRNASQVWANGGVAVLACVLHYVVQQRLDVCWPAVAAISTALGDTLASELTSLVTDEAPRSILQPWREVPIGWNGGVTATGFFFSMLGGWIIGVAYAVASGAPLFETVIWAGFFGLTGSAIDSFLGALVEGNRKQGHLVDGWGLMTNDQVNFSATALSAAMAALLL